MATNTDTEIQDAKAHNQAINAQIAERESKIEKYKEVSSSAEAIVGEIDAFITELKEVDALLEKIVIGNQPVGKGDLLGTCASLEGMKGTFSDIVSVCSKKIHELEDEINELRGQLVAET